MKIKCNACGRITWHNLVYGNIEFGVKVFECLGRNKYDFPCQMKKYVEVKK